MIGAEVTEMIQGYVVARTLETTEAELMHTVFPTPRSAKPCINPCLTPMGRLYISSQIGGRCGARPRADE